MKKKTTELNVLLTHHIKGYKNYIACHYDEMPNRSNREESFALDHMFKYILVHHSKAGMVARKTISLVSGGQVLCYPPFMNRKQRAELKKMYQNEFQNLYPGDLLS